MSNNHTHRIAYFVTPHGYGHAARTAAVMNTIYKRLPGVVFEIYTRVPVWFFNMSNQGAFNYHELATDIGLVQSTSMQEDLAETVRRLDTFLPFDPALLQSLAREIKRKGCEMVLCDIAPLGIAAAAEAGLSSILIENFTWDWIYEGYLAEAPGLAPHAAYLKEVFASAGTHIRTEPACDYRAPADLTTRVVSRHPRNPAELTRQRLGIPQKARLVMITMGGILTQYPFLSRLEQSKEIVFLVPGGSDAYESRGGLVVIPHHSDLYHPDLVEASDLVVGKLGYSTLAEAYSSGIPYVYIPRARFPETPPMSLFARQAMHAVELPEEQFFSGDWLGLLPELLERPRRRPQEPNGADQIGDLILSLMVRA